MLKNTFFFLLDFSLKEYLATEAHSYQKYYCDALTEWDDAAKWQEIHDGHAVFPWGVWKVAPVFTNYVNFLENTANEKEPFMTVIANGPCSLLWPRIGDLSLSFVSDENPYKKYLDDSFGKWDWSAVDIVKREVTRSDAYDDSKLIEIFNLGLAHEKQCFYESINYPLLPQT